LHCLLRYATIEEIMPNGNYYLTHKGKILRGFDLSRRFQRRILTHHFDPSEADIWLARAREELELLIPQIPYIGGKDNTFTKYLVRPSMLIPLVSVMRDEGVPIRTVGQVIFEMAEASYNLAPAPIRWWQGHKYFMGKTRAMWQRTAERTQRHQYPGDWVCEYVEGDGETFEYGLNMTACGLLKFWRAQGLEPFVPYLCLTDWALWRAQSVEVRRTQTLANGAVCCDYRYIGRCQSKDLPTGWPPESMPEWRTGSLSRATASA
jgi:hypothetical protein